MTLVISRAVGRGRAYRPKDSQLRGISRVLWHYVGGAAFVLPPVPVGDVDTMNVLTISHVEWLAMSRLE